MVVCSGGGLAAEAIGIRTGWPFGRYAYTGSLGLQLFGVPVVVAMAWAMMGWPALLAGRRVGPAAPLLGALILAAWDLFLDPQMVRDGHWRWLPTSWPKLHGIPLSNTIGWFAVALTMLALLDRLVPHVRNPSPLALSVPFALLGWTWFSETFGHLVFFRRPSVAMVGGIAMGLALVPVIRGRSLGQGRAQSAGGKP